MLIRILILSIAPLLLSGCLITPRVLDKKYKDYERVYDEHGVTDGIEEPVKENRKRDPIANEIITGNTVDKKLLKDNDENGERIPTNTVTPQTNDSTNNVVPPENTGK